MRDPAILRLGRTRGQRAHHRGRLRAGSYREADRGRYPFVRIYQTLEIYPDETTSRRVYQQRVTEAIPPA